MRLKLAATVLFAMSTALASPPSKRVDGKVDAYITVVAGARVADEMCPTSGQQETGWTKLVRFQSKAFANGDFEEKVVKEADNQRPSMDARESWCLEYQKNLESDLSKIALTPDFRKNTEVREAVCLLQQDYVSIRKIVPDFLCSGRDK